MPIQEQSHWIKISRACILEMCILIRIPTDSESNQSLPTKWAINNLKGIFLNDNFLPGPFLREFICQHQNTFTYSVLLALNHTNYISLSRLKDKAILSQIAIVIISPLKSTFDPELLYSIFHLWISQGID